MTRSVIGPFIKCPHPEMIESCGIAGFDFAVVDMEHTPLSPRDLYSLVLAAECRELDLVVRIPANSEEYFKWCLDLGVKSIQVPHVQSAADVRYAIQNSYFCPRGERGVCRFVRSADFSGLERQEYFAKANEQTQLILQVEGKVGLENIQEILEAGPFHILFIGSYDLSQSLGKPGQIWDPEVVSAIQSIISDCSKRAVRVGTFTDSPEGIKFWIDAGVHMIQYTSDLHLFMQGARHVLEQGVFDES